MKRSPRKPIGGATNRLAAPFAEAHTRAPAPKMPAPPLAPTTMGNGTVPPDLFSKEWRQKTETTRGASIEAIARAKTTEESKASAASSLPRSGSSRVGRVFLGGGMRAGEGKKLTGHSEYVMQVMREFFQKHDLHALLTVFREHDHDKSGTFEFPEFRDAMRSVNLDLTEKDMVALFRAADADGSGCLEFSEFINNFRKEGAGDAAEGRREQFFFSLSRPRDLLARPERLKLSRKVEGPPVTSRSLDEMLAIIEKKVDQTGPKAVFHRFDENRSGRLSIPEFVLAMKHYGVDCTEAQAEEVITSINKAYGSSMQTNLNYAPFAAFFTHKIDTENTSNTAMRRPKNLGDDADRDDDEHGRGAHTASGVDFKQAKSSMFAGVVKDSDRVDPSAATAEPNIQLLQTMRKLFKDHDIGALRKTFQEFDADKSGTFELAEFKEAMRVVDRTMPETDVETLFKAADADSSGQVDFSEFMGTLKKVEEIGRKRTVPACKCSSRRVPSPLPTGGGDWTQAHGD
jgi:Ca2+-binding EF-hand superfamily protein